MRVLVTGGSGFIGSVLVESLLRDGVNVVTLDRVAPEREAHATVWRQCDILKEYRVREVLKACRPTHVVHLAARTDLDERKKLSGYGANIEGTRNILQAIQATCTVQRAVIASSMLVCRPGYQPRDDRDYAPDTVYGRSKVLTEDLVHSARLHCPWTIVRPTTIWGPGLARLRTGLFQALRKGTYLHPRGPSCRRSYGFVGNTVAQIRALLETPPSEVAGCTFYLGDEPLDLARWVDALSLRLCGRRVRRAPRTLLRVVAGMGDLSRTLGGPAPLTSYRLRNMSSDNVLDIAPTLRLAGPPVFTLAEAIEITCRWIEGDDGLDWLERRRVALAA